MSTFLPKICQVGGVEVADSAGVLRSFCGRAFRGLESLGLRLYLIYSTRLVLRDIRHTSIAFH